MFAVTFLLEPTRYCRFVTKKDNFLEVKNLRLFAFFTFTSIPLLFILLFFSPLLSVYSVNSSGNESEVTAACGETIHRYPS